MIRFYPFFFAALLSLSSYGKAQNPFLSSQAHSFESCKPIAENSVWLFSGSNLNSFEFRPDSWEIEKDGSVVCRMETIKDGKGKERIRGMGYLWTKDEFGDFSLSLEYKLSEGANSGIFYRTDKDNPVQGGLEIQLMDNEGFQKKAKKVLPLQKLNASFYDGAAPKGDFSKPLGQWNQAELTCIGPKVSFFLTTRHSTRTRSLPRQFGERSTCGPHVTKCGFAKFKLYGSHASFQKIDGNAPRGLWP